MKTERATFSLLKFLSTFTLVNLSAIPLMLWLAVETDLPHWAVVAVGWGPALILSGFMGHRYERELLEVHYMARLAYWRLRDPQRAKELERQRRFGPERYKDHWIR